jgi:hypothetical protein
MTLREWSNSDDHFSMADAVSLAMNVPCNSRHADVDWTVLDQVGVAALEAAHDALAEVHPIQYI